MLVSGSLQKQSLPYYLYACIYVHTHTPDQITGSFLPLSPAPDLAEVRKCDPGSASGFTLCTVHHYWSEGGKKEWVQAKCLGTISTSAPQCLAADRPALPVDLRLCTTDQLTELRAAPDLLPTDRPSQSL